MNISKNFHAMARKMNEPIATFLPHTPRILGNQDTPGAKELMRFCLEHPAPDFFSLSMLYHFYYKHDVPIVPNEELEDLMNVSQWLSDNITLQNAAEIIARFNMGLCQHLAHFAYARLQPYGLNLLAMSVCAYDHRNILIDRTKHAFVEFAMPDGERHVLDFWLRATGPKADYMALLKKDFFVSDEDWLPIRGWDERWWIPRGL